jgi:3-oxoacyl-[acyl-carrier protein] reductase
MTLTGKVALVTGGSRGIGRAISIALAAAGANVAVNYRTQAAAADDVVGQITGAGGHAIAVRADVSVAADVAAMVDSITKQLGAVSILVNNAGIAEPRTIDTLQLSDFDEAIRVNLRSAYLVTAAVVPAMRAAKWGRLIFLSSVAASIGGVIGPHYAASKAGMLGLMHGYASQLVKEGITANAISPGLIESDMSRALTGVTPARVPMGRFGVPEEVADIAVLLAQNAYITGQNIHPNGGIHYAS